MVYSYKKQLMWNQRLNKFCTVVSEVSSFVGNPVYLITMYKVVSEVVNNPVLVYSVYGFMYIEDKTQLGGTRLYFS